MSALALSFSTVYLAGASCGNTVSRDCAAFSNERVSAWETVEALGQSQTFIDQEGNAVVLVLNERTDSEAFTGADTLGDEDEVGCRMTSHRRYDFDDGSTALEMRFTQFESSAGQPIDEQALMLAIDPQSPQGEALQFGFRFLNLTDAIELYGGDGVTQIDRPITTRAIENADVGGVVQSLIVEQTFTDPDFVLALAPDGASALTRVVMSDGLGLIAFDRADNARFVRNDL